MKRREFIAHAAYGLGATWLTSKVVNEGALALVSLPRKFSASDTVVIGKTGIKTSRPRHRNRHCGFWTSL